MKVVRKQTISNHCLICGVKNDLGLKANFYEMENGTLVALFRPGDQHQSYPNRMHGGMISAILDETVGRALLVEEPDSWGVTVEFTIKYRKPVPLNEDLKVIAKITENKKRIFKGSGILVDAKGEVLAEGKGVFFKQKLSSICDVDELSGVLIDVSDDVTEIDIDDIELDF